MISLKAGSPICNCKNPDTCIHMFILKAGDRTFTYKQANFISSVDVIDEDNKGVPLSMTLVDKGCVSNKSACPRGIIYNTEDNKSVYVLQKGVTAYTVHFNEKKADFFKGTDSIDFLVDYLMTKQVRDILPKKEYILRVGECKGYPFVNTSLNFMDGVSDLFNLAPRDVLWTTINVFPGFSWEADVSIGLEHEVEHYSQAERKKQQTAENRAQGKSQRGHRGWTKLPEYGITDKLEAEGKLSCKLGSATHDYSSTLKQEFKRKAKSISLVDKASETMDMLTKAFSTNEGSDAKIKLLSTEIKYPEIEIKGSGELKEDENTTELYMERQVSFGMAPLIGVSITLDLLQAFAAWYHQDMLLAAIRENLQSGEGGYDKGENAVFADGKFNLVVEGEIKLTLGYVSDAKNEWKWQYDEDTAAKLSLTLDVNFRAGARFYVASGALEIGGQSVAEGFVGLEANHTDKDKLDLVLYHNGVTAKVYVSYTYGLSKPNDVVNNHDDGWLGGEEPSNKTENNKSEEKEWRIHDKLEKQDSKARVNIF
ncbi:MULTISPECIES: hypothetical protein [Serratia]|uniref:hypothetical protein n=1 Tax=Serratia TaxID=613 RepID=UPI00080BBDA7|nr:hypothetical protein [Serratia sp. 506_PEND]